jgi:hypothetical protein
VSKLAATVAREPALLTSAVRASLLAAAGFGLDWSPEAIAGLMIALEAWLALITRSFSVPTSEVNTKIDEAKAVQRVEIHDYLAGGRPLRAARPNPTDGG